MPDRLLLVMKDVDLERRLHELCLHGTAKPIAQISRGHMANVIGDGTEW